MAFIESYAHGLTVATSDVNAGALPLRPNRPPEGAQVATDLNVSVLNGYGTSSRQAACNGKYRPRLAPPSAAA